MEDFDFDPAKMSITNLVSGAEVIAQFNPEEFQESVQPIWARLAAQGLSHEVHHYAHTSPYVVQMDLYFRAFSKEELLELHRARRHLLSWAHPRRIASELVGGGPPRLLLVWPGMLSIECFLTEARITHQRFNQHLRSTSMVASVSFEEDPTTLLTTEMVADDDLLRFGDPLVGIDVEV